MIFCVCDRIYVAVFVSISVWVFYFLFYFILRLVWIGPWIKGFRLSPEVVGRGPQGPNGAGLGLKKKNFLLNRLGLSNGAGRAGWVQA